ncbi:MAG: hypothetical protein WBE13_17140 [Candidatus Acidiferrum sp.]
MTQREKEIETRILDRLRYDPARLEIQNSTSDAKNLATLLGQHRPNVLPDTSEWNLHPDFMVDVIGGMTPDIVIRSSLSGQNRIYIEVEDCEPLGYGIEDSPITRYCLHLLATTTQSPKEGNDIRRAVLLCAPVAWFKVNRNAETWNHFLRRFSGLATAFDITLGELHADRLSPWPQRYSRG